MAEKEVSSYVIPVHKSLMQPDRMFGIGTTTLIIIICITILLCNFIHIFFIFGGLFTLLIIRLLCKKDPYLFDVLLDALFNQIDDYLA